MERALENITSVHRPLDMAKNKRKLDKVDNKSAWYKKRKVDPNNCNSKLTGGGWGRYTKKQTTKKDESTIMFIPRTRGGNLTKILKE